jgi:hypothetical protein
MPALFLCGVFLFFPDASSAPSRYNSCMRYKRALEIFVEIVGSIFFLTSTLGLTLFGVTVLSKNIDWPMNLYGVSYALFGATFLLKGKNVFLAVQPRSSDDRVKRQRR